MITAVLDGSDVPLNTSEASAIVVLVLTPAIFFIVDMFLRRVPVLRQRLLSAGLVKRFTRGASTSPPPVKSSIAYAEDAEADSVEPPMSMDQLELASLSARKRGKTSPSAGRQHQKQTRRTTEPSKDDPVEFVLNPLADLGPTEPTP